MIADPRHALSELLKTHPEVLTAPMVGVAFSGGLDSTVLLHVAIQLGLPVVALHVNHGLHPEAALWAKQACVYAAQLGVPGEVLTVNATAPVGESREAWAREQRYCLLRERLPAQGVLLTAHHADDQAETFLLKALRAEGGIYGMRRWARGLLLPTQRIARPFLSVSRAALVAYAQQHRLSWIEDPSNTSEAYDRNFLRHRILPTLNQRFSATTAFARALVHQEEQHSWAMQLLAEKHQQCQGSERNTVSCAKLLEQPAAVQKALLRAWLAEHGEVMGYRALEQLIQALGRGQAINVACGNRHWMRYRDDLYLLSTQEMVALTGQTIVWDGREPCVLPENAGVLTTDQWVSLGLGPNPVVLSFRRGGERVAVPGVGHQCLKKYFQGLGVPPWRRERIPLLLNDKSAVMVIIPTQHNDGTSGS